MRFLACAIGLRLPALWWPGAESVSSNRADGLPVRERLAAAAPATSTGAPAPFQFVSRAPDRDRSAAIAPVTPVRSSRRHQHSAHSGMAPGPPSAAVISQSHDKR